MEIITSGVIMSSVRQSSTPVTFPDLLSYCRHDGVELWAFNVPFQQSSIVCIGCAGTKRRFPIDTMKINFVIFKEFHQKFTVHSPIGCFAYGIPRNA